MCRRTDYPDVSRAGQLGGYVEPLEQDDCFCDRAPLAVAGKTLNSSNRVRNIERHGTNKTWAQLRLDSKLIARFTLQYPRTAMDFFDWATLSPYSIPIMGIVCGTLSVATMFGIRQWRKTRVAEMEATLKLEMIKQGRSADEIERVLRASARLGQGEPLPR